MVKISQEEILEVFKVIKRIFLNRKNLRGFDFQKLIRVRADFKVQQTLPFKNQQIVHFDESFNFFLLF